MAKWHGGKGSTQRKAQISREESDLRWELMSSKTTQERKEEIKQLLQKLKDKDKDNEDDLE